MLENIKYNLERVVLKKRNSTQKNKQKNNPPDSSFEGLHGREKKKYNMLNICSPTRPNDRRRYMRDILEQLPAPMMLLGDFNAHK